MKVVKKVVSKEKKCPFVTKSYCGHENPCLPKIFLFCMQMEIAVLASQVSKEKIILDQLKFYDYQCNESISFF